MTNKNASDIHQMQHQNMGIRNHLYAKMTPFLSPFCNPLQKDKHFILTTT
uniref:Uncharacterized protein n=1 Tax=Arundo donax TaxID=35708 RepID=A0A0A9EVZ6_ARUDO